MKHGNEEIEGERDERHERLVAHLLGELDAGQTARVEADLAADAEYRAQAERLGATIGLVRALDAPAPALSDAGRARVESEGAASGGGGGVVLQGPWHARPAVRAAAAMLILVSAAAAYRWSAPQRATGVEGEAVATLERPPGGSLAQADEVEYLARPSSAAVEEAESSTELAGDLSVLDSLGYGGSGSGTRNERAQELIAKAKEQHARGAPADSPAAGAEPQLEALGYVSEFRGPGDVAAAELARVAAAGGRILERTAFTRSQDPVATRSFESPESEATEAVGLSGDVALTRSEPDSDELFFTLGYLDGSIPDRSADAGFYIGKNGKDDSFERRGLTATESKAETELLDRLGLEPARLGQALQVLGYLDAEDELDLDSADGLDLRRRVLRSQVVRERVDALIGDCHRRPGESLDDMTFRHWGTRPFTATGTDALSTFAIDTDTASYTLARGMLERGVLPRPAQIRVEEFVNYFDSEAPAPVEDTFAIHTELGTSPFGRAEGQPEDTLLLRVAVRAKDVAPEERTPLALTFVVDVSGSMDTDNRIGLVKDSLRQLLTRLDGRDRVAIVAFSNEARVVLEPTSGAQRGRIESAIASLHTGGGTNADAGLVLGYGLADRDLDPQRNNRVVFLSDGVANIGDTDKQSMIEKTAGARAKGVYLNTVGFGIGNHNDALLEQLADDGDGVCNYVDSPVEARRAFVENFTGSFETVARDAKIQVEFDPAKVGSYRLIGYENRAIADREFRQDAVDAGEVQAGRAAVALYELRDVDLSGASLGAVRVRYKAPFDAGRAVNEEAGALEIETPIATEGAGFDFAGASTGFAKSALVAQTAEVLRRSLHARGDSINRLALEIERLSAKSPDPEFAEFAALFARNKTAFEALVAPATEGSGVLDELKYLHLELEREREADGQPDATVIAGLEQRIGELENRLRGLAFGPRGAAEDERR